MDKNLGRYTILRLCPDIYSTGKAEIAAGKMETLISTRAKVGYMLNLAKENVLILRKGDFLMIASLPLLRSIPFRTDIGAGAGNDGDASYGQLSFAAHQYADNHYSLVN